MQLENMSGFELCREADNILRENGFDIWGNPRTGEGFMQSKFENAVWDGAYRNNSERNRQ